MRLIRFLDSLQQIHHGVDQGNGSALRIQGDLFGNFTVTHQVVPVQKLLAPLEPRAIFCIGLNYLKHMAEMGSKRPEFPVLFMKSPASLQHPGDPIQIPTHLKSTQVDYECELAVVIGKRCKNVTRENALDFVLGYTIANDVSARDWQKQWGGGQFCRGKTFDTFCPLGPAIVTRDEIPHPNALRLQSFVNGEPRQDTNTSDMIFDVPTLIAFLSGSTTLLPGTVILTGTPGGVGMGMTPPRYLQAGDEVKMVAEGIGELISPVVAE
ncbi:MAG TPA: fumarylacetoacetate hydrolase family protein [Phycisphaerae bacterium]|jgi:2-keto-4-pentenoate hydratase/2-oxohepta-3-ene-1,7-dioic acid hydratase in catechol pathway|nr:fumarylacetoacetate hydrolase family protein [Phycisphaerae bacterium]